MGKEDSVRKLTHEEIVRTSAGEIVKKKRNPIITVIDNVRSAYNIGSIFRTSDAALVLKLHLCGYTPHPPRKEIAKTALGATESVPWEYHRHVRFVLPVLKEHGAKIFAVELTDESRPYTALSREDFPLALLFGNEISGISDDALSYCDAALEIPMHGIKQSLNVAVAYGIVVFECLRLLDRMENS